MSAAELVGLLLLPTDPEMLAEGIGGYRPPTASRSGEHPVWVEGRSKTVLGLMLAWDGVEVAQGVDTLDRFWEYDHSADGMVERILEGDDLDTWDVPGDLVGLDESGRQLTGPGYGPSALLLAQVRARSGDPSARVEYMEHPNHPGDPITPGAGWVCFAGGVLPAAGIGATSREALTSALDAFPEVTP